MAFGRCKDTQSSFSPLLPVSPTASARSQVLQYATQGRQTRYYAGSNLACTTQRKNLCGLNVCIVGSVCCEYETRIKFTQSYCTTGGSEFVCDTHGPTLNPASDTKGQDRACGRKRCHYRGKESRRTLSPSADRGKPGLTYA